MYVIREVVNCKPGKVRQMVEKFRTISTVLKEMGQEPLRVLTDVTGEPFWTIVAEAKVEKIDDFFATEQSLMATRAMDMTSSADLSSCQQRLDHLAVHVSEAEAPPLVQIGQPLVIHSQKMQHRRLKVVHVDAALSDVVAELVGGAVDQAGPHAAASHPHGEAARMVVAPVVGRRQPAL
jgi:hypothetical protein